MIIGLVAVILLAAGGYFIFTRMSPRQAPATTVEKTVMTDKENGVMLEDIMMQMDYAYMGGLEDVSGGNATGIAYTNYDSNGYIVYATFENLPALEPNFFYEGWVVRKNPQDILSTGALDMVEGVYINTFTSSNDLTDHDFYVLTLEPDDGDPAPADHILEGTLLPN